MRVLIYSETPEALAERDAIREGGDKASLCNPQFFNPSFFDKNCDKVITWDKEIADVYAGIGKVVDYRGEGEVEPVEPEEAIEPASVEVGGGLHEDTVAAVEKKVKAKRTTKAKPKAKK